MFLDTKTAISTLRILVSDYIQALLQVIEKHFYICGTFLEQLGHGEPIQISSIGWGGIIIADFLHCVNRTLK